MSKPKLLVIPVTPFQQNCTLLWDEASMAGAVCDPGGEVDRIMDAILQANVTVEKILLTHGHIDHAGGAAALKERLGVPIEGPQSDDRFLLDALDQSGAHYGMMDARPVTPDRWLRHNQRVTVGGLEFKTLHCPGHSPGSIVFFCAEHRFCLMGDVLFQGSIGRTDLPRGDHETLLASIRRHLLSLGDDVAFLPGHGPASTIGQERKSNPFIV